MNDPNLCEVIQVRLQELGYTVRQSPSSPNCWYASKPQRNYLFALIREHQSWRVNDITGNGALEQPRIERELKNHANR